MTQNEYEQYKRCLDEELEAGLALLRAAHAQQVNALELVYRMGLKMETLPKKPAAKSLAPRIRAGALAEEVAALLPRLPETFDRWDVLRALGRDPGRGSLYRVLQGLTEAGALTRETEGTGRIPARYKRPAG